MTEPPSLAIRTASIVIAMSLLAVLSWATIANRVPSALSPHSFAVVIPVFEGGSAFAVTVMPLLFVLWSVNLIDGRSDLPNRSVALFGVVSLGVLVWFVVGWSDGLEFTEPRVLIFWAVVNAVLFGLISVLVRRFRSCGSWWRTLLFQWLLFAWPAWCGFPWLGELI